MNTLSKHSLISLSTDDEKEKNSLLKTVAKRKIRLMQIATKVEMLKLDLDIIKREYDIRIGKLYLKDDQLDLEITRFHRIKAMLQEGMSYDDAVKKINDDFQREEEILSMRFDEIADEENLMKQSKEAAPFHMEDLKKLWKKLLFQLHPDLTIDKDEKKKREEIMRKINTAYALHDFGTLKSIEQQHYSDDPKEVTVASLRETLESIENSIITMETEYIRLRNSEWFMWKKKSEYAKKKDIDLFKELEEKLLEDIARKIKIVHALRAEFDEKGYY